MIRKAKAAWQGTGKDGTGKLTYRFRCSVFDAVFVQDAVRSEKGTNPEELIAAAHAGCFTMALAFQLQGAGFTPTELTQNRHIFLDKDGDGFKISKSHLTLRANVPGIEQAKFEELARAAEKNCPVSKVLNAEISMEFTLA